MAKSATPTPAPQGTDQGARLRISPAARRAAQTAGLDLDRLHPRGTGPGGAIALVDIAGTRDTSPVSDAPPQAATAPTGMRAAITAAMSRSRREFPHYYLSHAVDLTVAQAFIAEINAARTSDNRVCDGHRGALFLRDIAKHLQSPEAL